jgi:hypothetical protein
MLFIPDNGSRFVERYLLTASGFMWCFTIVQELSSACKAKPPTLYVIRTEPGINAFAAGNKDEDSVSQLIAIVCGVSAVSMLGRYFGMFGGFGRFLGLDHTFDSDMRSRTSGAAKVEP